MMCVHHIFSVIQTKRPRESSRTGTPPTENDAGSTAPRVHSSKVAAVNIFRKSTLIPDQGIAERTIAQYKGRDAARRLTSNRVSKPVHQVLAGYCGLRKSIGWMLFKQSPIFFQSAYSLLLEFSLQLKGAEQMVQTPVPRERGPPCP